MDKKFLEEHNLMEAAKRSRMIMEYMSGANANVFEDDTPAEDDMPAEGPNAGGAPAPGGDPGMGGAPGGDPGMGGAPGGDPAMGGAPGGDPAMGGAPAGPDAGGAPMDGGMPGGDPGMGGDGSQGVEGFQPQGEQQPMVPQDGAPGEDEDIINVDDLTDSQEHTENKVDHLSSKVEKLIGMLDKFEADIDANNQHIEQLKQEFEKRNPTQVEKMTLRANKGYPFTDTPEDFWDRKEAEGTYSPDPDNNGIDDQRYQITKDDIDNVNDWNSIYKSIKNGDFHQDLSDLLR